MNWFIKKHWKKLFSKNGRTAETMKQLTKDTNSLVPADGTVDSHPSETSFMSGKSWFNGTKRFVKTETRFDKIIFPHNLDLETRDPLKMREVRKMIEDLREVVNGEKFFSVCPIDKVLDTCQCNSVDQARWRKILDSYHCKDIQGKDPDLWRNLPNLLNHLFSNGAMPLNWN